MQVIRISLAAITLLLKRWPPPVAPADVLTCTRKPDKQKSIFIIFNDEMSPSILWEIM